MLTHAMQNRLANTLEIAQLIGHCTGRLAQAGLRPQMASDMTKARELIIESRLAEQEGAKPYLTDFLNPDEFTYTSATCFWIFLRNAEQKIVATVAFRMDRLSGISLRHLHDEILRHKYAKEAALDIDPRRLPPAADRITGNVAFVAELWMDGKHAGKRSVNTVYFAALAMTTLMGEWPDLDHVYGFVRKRDALLGAVQRYGFPHAYPGCLSYSSPISAAPGDLYFIHATAEDVSDLIRYRNTLPQEEANMDEPLRIVHSA